MNEIIAYCGLVCHSCPILLATREKNGEKRDKMRVDIAEQIRKHYGTEYRPQDITDCDGCKSESGRLFSGSRKCEIRKCAREKSIENCAHCNEYACERLDKFFATDPEAKKRLDVIRSAL
ncbi:MAG: DUF3795 domain-containing protein [Sedimentisphaerales bacterium]